MDTAANYRLNEERAARRVAEFGQHPNPATLEQEIALCRYLIEESVNTGHHQTAAVLLTCLNKLARTHEHTAMRANELLAKSVVLAICQQFLTIVAGEFQGLPGWEDRLDRAATKIGTTIDGAVNPPDAIG